METSKYEDKNKKSQKLVDSIETKTYFQSKKGMEKQRCSSQLDLGPPTQQTNTLNKPIDQGKFCY